MAPVFKSNSASTSSTTNLPLEAGVSALTTAGESLFMCSTKEGHTCYHACRGHGKYPLWSDDMYMIDDMDEDEGENQSKAVPERRRAWNDVDDSSDYSGEEEWLEEDADDVDDSAFWQEIEDSVARHRARQNQRIHYSASDLRFLLTDGESTANTEMGPIVGVITTKPPPEYVWYMVDDDNWMRGSIPEKLSEEQDGAYYRYRYHTWDRIPNEDVRNSSSDDEYDDEDEVSVTEEPGPYDNENDFEVDEEDPESNEEDEEIDVEGDDEEEDVDVEVEESLQEVEVVTDNGDGQSWSELADLQEKQQTTS